MTHVVFDASNSEEFLDHVRDALDASDHLETSWHDDGHPGHDLLVIHEVHDD